MAAARRKRVEAPAAAAEPQAVTIALPPKVDFIEARRLHEALSGACEAPELVLDAGAVEQLSTAAVLVLVSYLNAREAITPPAAVLNPSGAFVDAFSELGLFDKLMRMEFRS